MENPLEVREILHRNILRDWTNHPDWLGVGSNRSNLLETEVPKDIVMLRMTVGQDGSEATRGLVAELTSSQIAPRTVTMTPRYHYGVYGRVIVDRKILLVRKSSGPYKGLLDMPGGAPMLGEKKYETLVRELQEELNSEVLSQGPWNSAELVVERSSDGARIRFHHHAHWADVALSSPPSLHTRSEDTTGVEWFDLDRGDPNLLSSLARALMP